MKSSLFAMLFFLSSFALHPQVILTIEGEEIINTEAGASTGYVIPREYPTSLTFRNNLLSFANASGYMLLAGDETPGINNNNLDGEIITGNRFIWKGTVEDSWTHSVFTGYNINVTLKYNYLERTPNGIQRKSNGMTDESGVIAYNIIKNPRVGIVVKGINGIRIYNNTLYSDKTPSQTYRALIDIHTNTDGGLNASSKGTKIFNNIFYTRNRVLNIWVYEEACLEGFECDYNIYWCESGEPVFKIGDKFKSFSQWQAMGYDSHSLVMNPKFIDFDNFVPQDRLDFGKNLGGEFNAGLAVDAIWGNNSPQTAFQDDIWQVGARVIAEVVIIEEPLDTATQVYPNPAKGHFYVLNNAPDKIYKTLIVYNSMGDVIMQQNLEGQLNAVHLSTDLSAGLYTIKLDGDNLPSFHTKLVIID